MKRETSNFLFDRNEKKGVRASFRNTNKLTVLNSKAIKRSLLGFATRRCSELEIDLKGIKFIDSAIIDTFNLLSRMARRYGSRVILTNVSTELSELIELVKMHSVFDIQKVVIDENKQSVA